MVFEREAREFLIILHFHVSTLEYKLGYDGNLTRASRSNKGTRRADPRRTRYREYPRDSFDDSPSLYDDNASSVSNRAVGYPPQQHHNHTREFESTMGHLDRIARERERMQRRVVSKRRW